MTRSTANGAERWKEPREMNAVRPASMATALAVAAAIVMLHDAKADEGVQRRLNAADVRVQDGYNIEAVVANLSAPTTATFDGQDLLIAESGFAEVAHPRVLHVKPDGAVSVEASGGLEGPVTGLLLHGGRLYVSHKA